MNRITQLDGLRALAVLAVICQHRHILNSGMVGVDVFFVLSGFLITRILISSKDGQGVIPNFYRRRIQRILPAYLVTILLVSLCAWKNWGQLAPWYILFAGNLEVALHPSSRGGPWGALWSVAVEEHFYLVWPLLVLRLERRTLSRILIAVLVASPLLRAIAMHFTTDFLAIYYLTPFRLDGLAVGSLLAIGYSQGAWSRWMRPFSVAASFLLPAAMMLLEFDQCRFSPWFISVGYSAVAIGSAGLVFLLVDDRVNWLIRFLRLPILIWLGTISYSLYLIEEPIIHAASFLAVRYQYHHGLRLIGASFLAGVLYAALSWRFLEKPLLRHKWRSPERPLSTGQVMSSHYGLQIVSESPENAGRIASS